MTNLERPDTRMWIDRAVNLAMLWNGSMLAGTGLAMEYRLNHGATLWGMGWQAWGDIHFYLGLTMLFLISLHFFRHRRWWWSVLCQKRSWAFILAALVALILLFGPLLSPDNK